MYQTALSTLATLALVGFSNPSMPVKNVLAEHTISLENRYPVKQVSDVFEDNILLTLSYMRGTVHKGDNVNWSEVKAPFHAEFVLPQNTTFAFHRDVLPQYNGKVSLSTNAHFGADEGFKSDGYLIGDGVCHLASLFNWVAQDAHLDVNSPTNHDFANIPEISKQYGTAIYDAPGQLSSSALQNLYITNNRAHDIYFYVDFDGKNLKTSVVEAAN